MLLMWVIPFLGSGEFSILARGGFWNLRKRGFHSPPLKANLKIAKGRGGEMSCPRLFSRRQRVGLNI